MHWGFRVATDVRSGGGHIARCKALAAALGDPVTLFSDPAEPDARDRWGWAGDVKPEYSREGAEHAITALARGGIAALIVDSYTVGEHNLDGAAAKGFTAVFRDGPPYGRERLAIDPNPSAVEDANVLRGPAYMPLAPTFASRHLTVAGSAPQPSDRPLSVLIAFGSRDSSNRTMTTLQGLMQLSRKPNVIVALPPTAPHAAEVAGAVEAVTWADRLPEAGDLGGIYSQFDLAIGAPGVSQFERACCGLPSILIPQNERQQPLARCWEASGAVIYCPPSPSAVADAVTGLVDHPARLGVLRERSLSLVDGQGAARLAAALKDRIAR